MTIVEPAALATPQQPSKWAYTSAATWMDPGLTVSGSGINRECAGDGNPAPRTPSLGDRVSVTSTPLFEEGKEEEGKGKESTTLTAVVHPRPKDPFLSASVCEVVMPALAQAKVCLNVSNYHISSAAEVAGNLAGLSRAMAGLRATNPKGLSAVRVARVERKENEAQLTRLKGMYCVRMSDVVAPSSGACPKWVIGMLVSP